MATISRLETLHSKTGSVEVAYRKLVCEIAVLRLFYLMENTFKSIACRVACGAAYGDGSQPQLLIKCRSSADAEVQMKTTGRLKPLYNLKWSTAKEIKGNLRYLLDPKDHFMSTLDKHGTYIDEVRRVRNRIAHNNSTVRENFQTIVKRHYGAELNSMTPGTLLLSPRRTPVLIEDYLSRGRLLVKLLARL
jgi:hypothetical protein